LNQKQTRTTMKILFKFIAVCSLLFAICETGFAQGTAFTYQGRLNGNGSPASGTYDFRFRLATDPLANNYVGSPYLTNGVAVNNGLFMATMDFGPGIFAGSSYWLEVDVRTNGAGSYTALTPLQALTPTPYAIFANTASNLSGTVSSSGISGPYGNAVTLNNAANQFIGTFAGNGTSVSNVNAVALNGLGAGNFWQLSGNNVASGQFLGSTNNQPVEIRVNGTRVFRLEPDSRGLGAGNLIGGFIGNTILQPGSGGNVIAGGGVGGATNVINTNSSGDFIGAGSANQVGPGVYNAVIAGGFGNNIGPNGFGNSASSSVIGGGNYNTNNEADSVIGGGEQNYITGLADHSVIAGGGSNIIVGSLNLPVYAVIGGGSQNIIQTNTQTATIGGGRYNMILTNAQNATIGGGDNNIGGSFSSTIGGGSGNLNAGEVSTIGGGEANVLDNVSFGAATIGGGLANTNFAVYSTISGGAENWIQTNAAGSSIGGGVLNYIGSVSGFHAPGYSTIAGGGENMIGTDVVAAVIGGGFSNLVTGSYATVPGGSLNVATGRHSFATGYQAQAANDGAFVWADSQNAAFGSTTTNQFNVRADGGVRFVTGGAGVTVDGLPLLASGGGSGINIQPNSSGAPNIIGGSPDNFVANGVVGATIGGGGATNYEGYPITNSVSADFGTVGGGDGNSIQTGANESFLGGGGFNSIQANAFDSFLGGGIANSISNSASDSFLGGGQGNSIWSGSGESFLGGGADNSIQQFVPYSFLGGGADNSVKAESSFLGGGQINSIQTIAYFSFLGGGEKNTNAGAFSVIGGGTNNLVSGNAATVPGGSLNVAGGNYSFAAGQQAQALHQGSFVWADSQGGTFSSTTNDEFNIRANNGVRIQADKGIHLNANDRPIIVRDWDVFAANAPGYKAGIGRWGLFMEPTILTIGIPANDVSPRYFQIAKYNTNGTPTMLVQVDQSGTLTNTGNIYCGSNVYAHGVLLTSDRNAKENFVPLDAQAVLARVAALPMSQWNYKSDAARLRHIGPMAQDFHEAFGLNGSDDKHISLVDESGVALAAIQGLNQKLNEKDAEIQALKARLEKLEQFIGQNNGGRQ
jgi:trimeric autotransporter adhesin